MWELFPGTPSQPSQSNKREQHTEFVTTHWLQNIDCIPIGYAFRPHLRDRLTLRRLALRRNPWTFGGSVSHTPVVTHVSIRTSDTSSGPHDPPSQAYGTLSYHAPCGASAASVTGLAPLHLPRRTTRSVSYYAFFK